jgi:hypothetical protein
LQSPWAGQRQCAPPQKQLPAASDGTNFPDASRASAAQHKPPEPGHYAFARVGIATVGLHSAVARVLQHDVLRLIERDEIALAILD